jgi:ankyrin repeat protein
MSKMTTTRTHCTLHQKWTTCRGATIDRHWRCRRHSERHSNDPVGLGIKQRESRRWELPHRARGRPECAGQRSWAPLHFASRYGHVDMARLLLGHGVDPNIQRDDLWSPLHLASANGHLNVAELLVQHGASVDIANDRQETPLYQAVWNGKIDIARLLIDHGADLHSTDSDGQTPLHAASQRGHLEVIKLLLRWGADVDVLNKANKTAAELASENGKAKIATFISEYKADASILNEVRSTTLDTAQSRYGVDEDGKDEAMVSLHAAADEGNVEVVQLVLERGADINSRNAHNRLRYTEQRQWETSMSYACSSSGAQRWTT